MPILDIVVQQAAEAQKKQQTLISLGATQALAESMRSVMESYELPLRQMGEIMVAYTTPLKMIQEAFDSQAKAILQMQEVINAAPIVQLGTMLQEIGETHKRMADAINAASILNVAKLVNFNLGYPFIQEGEIIEDKTQVTTQNTHKIQPLVLPQQVLQLPFKNPRSKMGLKQISGGNFRYKRNTLKGISLRNREGQALELILANSDLFISDQLMQEKLYVKDIFDESKIIQLLKNKFKLNGLRAMIQRQGNGYIFLEIKYIQ